MNSLVLSGESAKLLKIYQRAPFAWDPIVWNRFILNPFVLDLFFLDSFVRYPFIRDLFVLESNIIVLMLFVWINIKSLAPSNGKSAAIFHLF